jgi:uridine kinase
MSDRSGEAFVVAISGMSGAGKSSVVRGTVERLGNATALYFDDYVARSTYPPDLLDWLARGADVDEWKTPHLAADLRALRSAGTYEFVIVEEPFGRRRAEMHDLIDASAHLDVPTDVLLARRLLRRLTEEREQFGDRLLDQLHRDLTEHLTTDRSLELAGAISSRAAADIILDGRKTLDELTETLANEIVIRANTRVG